MENILVSSCLLGLACRYDGKSKLNENILKLKEKYNLVPFCPEIYGGLPTPRNPSERQQDGVFMCDGTDVTAQYQKGAEEALRLFYALDCKAAVLKAKSPSCGIGKIYDGSFTGTLTHGDGVTAELFLKNNIPVYTENNFTELLK